MTTSEPLEPEEPWEAEIEALLGQLPAVEPPADFLVSALDHGPLHAGRIMVGLLSTAVVSLALTIAVGADGRGSVIPEVDLRQAVSARGGGAVSVLVQNGRLDWANLPDSGRQVVAGEPAWVDEDLQLTVLQAGDDTITIVGMSPDEVSSVIGALPDEPPSLYTRARDLAGAMSESLGFPSTG